MSKVKDPRYKAARRRVQEIKGFYSHLAVYLSVIAMLAALDWITGNGLDWVIFPALGWGVAVLIHASQVLVVEHFFGKEWEERKIRELLGEKPKRGAALGLADDGAWDEETADEEQVALHDLIRATREHQGRSEQRH